MSNLFGVLGVFALVLLPSTAHATPDPFAPIDALLPAPNEVRSVTGRPGAGYWQQEADFVIDVTVDPEALSYSGTARLTYTNNSPDTLDVLWLALDQNRFEHPPIARFLERLDRITRRTSVDTALGVQPKLMRRWQDHADRDFGYRTLRVTGARGQELVVDVQGTLARVSLPVPLAPKKSVTLDIAFSAALVDADAFDARSGYERLEDGTLILGLAHWFPRPVAYSDFRGWHLEPFIEQGEFTQEFGDYTVNITVPDTHVVAATGELTNPQAVLSPVERERLALARAKADAQTAIITREEADARRAATPSGTKTWTFRASPVRDFAFATSQAFLWDAMAVPLEGRKDAPLAQAFYPHEGMPVWQRFGVEAVAHTLEVYSSFTFPYPWPQATAVNGVINSGMEYPMISFNGPRPHPEDSRDGVYTAANKYGVIGIVVHETGHFFFPMIVGSDERVWMWQDEGINSFLELIANSRWEANFVESARRRGGITAYMKAADDQPIMASSDSLISRGVNSYTKPATALMVLRELVIGRDAFDRAFAAYARAWAFKRATPADFFRIMEQESGVDLDWFWRAWFYGTDHVDVGVDRVRAFVVSPRDAESEAQAAREQDARDTLWRGFERADREEGVAYRADTREGITDTYTRNDRHTPLPSKVKPEGAEAEALRAIDRVAWQRALDEGLILNVVDLRNHGGAPTPVPLVLTYEDGTTEALTLPVHIWRLEPEVSQQVFARDKVVVGVTLDPDNATVDAETGNNTWPPATDRQPIFLRAPDTKRPDSLMREEREAAKP